MTEAFDTIFEHGRVFLPGGLERVDVGIRDGRIVALDDLTGSSADERVNCTGLTILPGVIDTQVHFREPGMEHKEDLASGTEGAVMGGVTGIFEMPNTKPLTITAEALQDKLDRAAGRSWCDHAFFIGGTAENAEQLPELERLPGCCGVKVFMGSSTGNLLVANDEPLLNILRNGRRRMSVHSEDEHRLIERRALVEGGADVAMHPVWRDVETAVKATNRLIGLARRTGRPVHVLHITTAEEMEILARAKDVVTVETTPQHLTLAGPEAYEELGSKAQMNPPIRDGRHRDGLWWGIRTGVVDVIGSDHAPHTAEEKDQPYPQSPSGMPGVQTLVPIMLDHVAAGRLSLARFVDLTSAGPQRLFNIRGKGRIALGYDADLTIVDLAQRQEITDDWMRSKAGWTPFNGKTVTGWPKATVIRGHIVMRDGERMGDPIGRPVEFVDGAYKSG